MKVLVIGLGSIGYRHARNLIDLGHTVTGWDPDEAASSNASVSGVAMRDNILDAFGEANAVVIASPSVRHLEQMTLAISMGKHVLVEKPIATGSRDEVAYVLSRAKDTGLVVMTGYNLRFHSSVLQAREWIDEYAIGEAIWASVYVCQYNDEPDYLRDGVILNWSHEIDLALHLLGPAEVLCANARISESGSEDMAVIVLSHRCGCRTTIHMDYVTKPQVRSTSIFGEGGRISLCLASDEAPEHRSATLQENSGDMIANNVFGKDTFDSNYVDEMRAFIDRIEGRPAPIGATGWDGLAALDICLAAKRMAGLS